MELHTLGIHAGFLGRIPANLKLGHIINTYPMNILKNKAIAALFVIGLLLANSALLTFAAGAAPTIGNCQVFPSNNPWNLDISNLPVHSNSGNIIANIGADDDLHPDFGGDGEYGIPYEVVGSNQPEVPVDVIWYPEDSEEGPFPIPLNARIEGGSDAHILVLEEDNCILYELYASERSGNGFEAGSAAVFDLKSNELRTDNWPTAIDEEYGLTSADAAGLPILPGLIRYDEAESGEINHAIRFTANTTRRDWIYPATHQAGSTDSLNAPPMGLRVRLKSNYDISAYTGHSRVILEAMKKYGMILADNGSDWYFQGSQDSRWDDDDLNQLKSVPGTAFEVVDTSSITAQSVGGAEFDNADPGSFKDVFSNHANFDAIEYVKSEDIVEGYADGTYKPSQRINRAEFTKIIVGAAFDYNSNQDPSGYDIFSLSGLTFSDLDSGAWYNPYLRRAVEEGVIGGYPDGTFKPAESINFAEAAKIVVISFDLEYGSDTIWYKPFTDALTSKGAVPSSIRNPDQKITRGEMAEIIYRLQAASS